MVNKHKQVYYECPRCGFKDFESKPFVKDGIRYIPNCPQDLVPMIRRSINVSRRNVS
jgi:hypothetical protein